MKIKYKTPIKLYSLINKCKGVHPLVIVAETEFYYITHFGSRFIKTNCFATKDMATIESCRRGMAMLAKRLLIPYSKRFHGKGVLTSNREILGAINSYQNKLAKIQKKPCTEQMELL